MFINSSILSGSVSSKIILYNLKVKNDENKSDSLNNLVISNIDTVFLQFNSTDSINIPVIKNNLTRVVLVKEKDTFEFLKYLFPILTLLLGIIIKEMIDKWSNTKKIKKSGTRWTAELRSLEEPIRNQIKSLNSFIAEHNEESFKIPKLNIYPALNGEVFKSLDKDDLIKYH